MATRRTVHSAIDGDERTQTTTIRPSTGSSTTPAVPTSVVVKLLAFTFAMVVLPISSYFLTVHTIFKGNSIWAGVTAAVMANVVLVGYIIAAVREDQSEQPTTAAGVTRKTE